MFTVSHLLFNYKPLLMVSQVLCYKDSRRLEVAVVQFAQVKLVLLNTELCREQNIPFGQETSGIIMSTSHTCGNSTACCLVTKAGSLLLPPPLLSQSVASLTPLEEACSQH